MLFNVIISISTSCIRCCRIQAWIC